MVFVPGNMVAARRETTVVQGMEGMGQIYLIWYLDVIEDGLWIFEQLLLERPSSGKAQRSLWWGATMMTPLPR